MKRFLTIILILLMSVSFVSAKETYRSPAEVAAGNAAGVHAGTGKTTPVDADEIGIIDSAASYVYKVLTWANLKATLKTYFDTLYASAVGYAYSAGYVDFATAISTIGATETTLVINQSETISADVTVPATCQLSFAGQGKLNIGKFSIRDANYQWTQSSYYKTIAFTSGGTHEIIIGDTLVGETSGASAKVGDITTTSGTWAGGDAAGTLILVGQSGTFQSENLLGALAGATYDDDQCTIGGNTSNDSVYYLEASGGGQPQVGGGNMSRRYSIYKDGTELAVGQGGHVYWTCVNALKEDELVWQDADSLGSSTVYIKTDGTDPDSESTDYYQAGHVVQINSGIIAGNNQHIFTGDGDVGGRPAIREAYPEWWGVDGTSDQTEINKALWFHKRVLLNGAYSTTDKIQVVNGSSLIGEPRSIWYPYSGTITPSSAVTRGIEVLNQRGFTIDGVRIDMSNMLTGSHGIHVEGAFFASIKNCQIRYLNDSGGTPNTTAGVYLCRNNNGSYYNVLENNHVAGGSDEGVGFLFDGNAAFPNLNHTTVIGCTAQYLYDGFVLNDVAGAMQFYNCAGSFNDNNGVTINDHLFGVNVGYPTWIGGEVSDNGGYGFEGNIFVMFTSSFDNVSGTLSSDYAASRFKMVPNDTTPYLDLSGSLRVNKQFGIGADNTQEITSASDTIDIDHGAVTLIPTSDVALTSTPTIPAGFDGQILVLKGGGSYTTRIADNSTVSGSGLVLKNAKISIAATTVIVLQYDEVKEKWVQLNDAAESYYAGLRSLSASDTISSGSYAQRIQGNGAPVTLTSDPQISDPSNIDGSTEICICGASGSNTVTLVDGNGLRLRENAILGYEDCIYLRWYPGWDDWVEIGKNTKPNLKKRDQTITTEIDLPTNVVTDADIIKITGDDDTNDDVVDLQDGLINYKTITFYASANVDANDTITIGMTDTTCTNCPAVVFDKVGENATLTWDGSTWIVLSLNNNF